MVFQGPSEMKDRERAADLVAMASRPWAGEAEIVRTYFARHRTRERDVLWLEAQAFKETLDLRMLPRDLQEEALRTGTVAHHPGGAELQEKLRCEMNHFRLIAELAEELTGRPVTLEGLPHLAEEEKLQRIRAPYRAGNPFERKVVMFTEGGGGAMYLTLAEMDGGDFERKMARNFRVIYEDEVYHGPAMIHDLDRLARGAEDWSFAIDLVGKIGRQRLRMRNEMFSFPLTDERLEEIAAGKIDPWPMPIPL
jgi:hypothetical protein